MRRGEPRPDEPMPGQPVHLHEEGERRVPHAHDARLEQREQLDRPQTGEPANSTQLNSSQLNSSEAKPSQSKSSRVVVHLIGFESTGAHRPPAASTRALSSAASGASCLRIGSNAGP